jgi:two-component system invasion response regulator UvrY
MLKILIADDHVMVRRSIKLILLEDFPAARIDEAENGDVLVSKAIAGEWDIVIADITMPVMSGLEATRRIKSHSPVLPVLILSMHADEQYATSAVKAGASGYLSKERAQDELTTVVRLLLSGGTYLPDAPLRDALPPAVPAPGAGPVRDRNPL